MHTAPGVPQARPPSSVTVTSPIEPGLTVTSHRSLRPSTRFAPVTLPPATDTDWSRNVRKLIEMPSLNAILSLNGLDSSCSAGACTKLAVSGATAASTTGPATVAAGVLVNSRRFPPRVQIAPETAHSRPPGSVIVTASSVSGATVISHRSLRPSTRRAPVTSPPDTVNESSRIDRKPIPMSSLNATRKRNASSPSCASGTPWNSAVSATGSGPSSVVAIPSDSERPSAVQIAPASSHGRPASIRIVRSSAEPGSISNSHTLSPSSCPPPERPAERAPGRLVVHPAHRRHPAALDLHPVLAHLLRALLDRLAERHPNLDPLLAVVLLRRRHEPRLQRQRTGLVGRARVHDHPVAVRDRQAGPVRAAEREALRCPRDDGDL